MSFRRCWICNDYTGNNENKCAECLEIRALNPVLFDYLISVMERKIEHAITTHEDNYDHSSHDRRD